MALKGIRIKDSPQFNFRFDQCKNVHIESIYITAPALSPNTDGIHIENTNNVGIYNSVVSNGDDCVSIGSGCYDVDIRNITCGPSHGIRYLKSFWSYYNILYGIIKLSCINFYISIESALEAWATTTLEHVCTT